MLKDYIHKRYFYTNKGWYRRMFTGRAGNVLGVMLLDIFVPNGFKENN